MGKKTIEFIKEKINQLSDTSNDLDKYQMELIGEIQELIKNFETMTVDNSEVVSGGGVRITKEQTIKLLKWMEEKKIYNLPFDIMCYEYGKMGGCDECEDECIHWNGLETDDIETLEEDDEDYYVNFELRF